MKRSSVPWFKVVLVAANLFAGYAFANSASESGGHDRHGTNQASASVSRSHYAERTNQYHDRDDWRGHDRDHDGWRDHDHDGWRDRDHDRDDWRDHDHDRDDWRYRHYYHTYGRPFPVYQPFPFGYHRINTYSYVHPRRFIFYVDARGFRHQYWVNDAYWAHYYDPVFYHQGRHIHVGCRYNGFFDGAFAGIAVNTHIGVW